MLAAARLARSEVSADYAACATTRSRGSVTERLRPTPTHLADKIRKSGAVEGERKQVTVLFADVGGLGRPWPQARQPWEGNRTRDYRTSGSVGPPLSPPACAARTASLRRSPAG